MSELMATCLPAAMDWEHFRRHAESAAQPVSVSDIRQAWVRAGESMAALSKTEAEAADRPGLLPLPPGMTPTVARLLQDPRVEAAFGQCPVSFVLVELNDLMVSDPILWSDSLETCLSDANGKVQDDDWLARSSFEFVSRLPVFTTACQNSEWVVSSEEADLRLLETSLAKLDDLSAGLTLRLGRVPPIVHAARLDGRLLLLKGHHRARCLKMLGVKFMPCMVSTCHHIDDVRRLAPHLCPDDLTRWFAARRPPMLRDYERQSLVYWSAARRPMHTIRLQISSETRHPAPALSTRSP